MDQQFKKGDVVRLKSGGPKMTVTSIIQDDGSLECTWFPVLAAEKPSWYAFDKDALEIAH
ncbi:MAG: DUF2158 domain-containing protein [Acidobacteriota bacterium]